MNDEEKIEEVSATMRLSGFQLTDDDFSVLRNIRQGKSTYDEARTEILNDAHL